MTNILKCMFGYNIMYNYELFQYKNFLKIQSFCTLIQKLPKIVNVLYSNTKKFKLNKSRNKYSIK